MSRREPHSGCDGPPTRGERARAYLRRFFTSWVAEDPDPTYSPLDRADGLDQDPDPVATPRHQLPESDEVHEFGTQDSQEDQLSERSRR